MGRFPGWRAARRPREKPAIVDGHTFATAGEALRFRALSAHASDVQHVSTDKGLIVFKFRRAGRAAWRTETFHTILPKRHKFNARATTLDGIRFASRLEATVYARLKLQLAAGEIHTLTLQRSWPLVVNGQTIAVYRSDFDYVVAASGEHIVVDAKGHITPEYRLKAKLYRAVYGVGIVEVRR